jgi:hypothetical protein
MVMWILKLGLWLRLTEEDYKTPIWWDMKDNFRKDM